MLYPEPALDHDPHLSMIRSCGPLSRARTGCGATSTRPTSGPNLVALARLDWAGTLRMRAARGDYALARLLGK